MSSSTGVVLTTYNRPAALARSLPQIVALGWPVLVVDDGSAYQECNLETEGWDRIQEIISESEPPYPAPCVVNRIIIPQNRGLAAALNIGLSYWLADPAIEWISCFQDDVDVHPETRSTLESVQHATNYRLMTGHDAAEHPATRRVSINGIECVTKANCRATHLHAHRSYWESVMPIRSLALHAPHKIPGAPRGMGSRVDHWIVSEAPRARKEVVCIPGLVRTFLWHKEDSTWDNEVKLGEDGPLRG